MRYGEIQFYDLIGKTITNSNGFPFTICEFVLNLEYKLPMIGLGDHVWPTPKAHTWCSLEQIFGEDSGWTLQFSAYEYQEELSDGVEDEVNMS